MATTGVILLCHGSRGDRALKDLSVTMQRMVTGVTAILPRAVAVTWGALQFNSPGLEEAAESLIAGNGNITAVIVVPYFLFSGRHVDEDIPEIIETLAARYPDVTFTLSASLGEGELFVPQVADRIRAVVPEMWREIPAAGDPPETIEGRSMDIIEQLLPPGLGFSDSEKAVVKRIVHASGDPQVAGLVRFSPGAVESGINALKNGSPVFTDVRMAAAGINRSSAEACGCTVRCALEEAGGAKESVGNITRAAAAINYLGRRLDGAVVAIGNAPTALLALVKLIEEENIRPALVAGIPVGFVKAAESKEVLMQSAVPYITVTGTRGGSAMAAATVNAVLKLALR